MSGGFGEPVQYVTILDLKERWLKKKQQEAEEERIKKESEEYEKNKMVYDSLNELKTRQKDEQVETSSAGDIKLSYGGRRRGGMRRGGWNGVKDTDGVNNEVRFGVVEVRLNNKLCIDRRAGGSGEEMNVYRKNGLEVDDGKIGEDERAKFSGARYGKGKRYVRKGRGVKDRIYDVIENVGVDEKSGGEKMKGVGSVGEEKATGTNCPCHSRSENQDGGGFWVCKYMVPGSVTEFEGSVNGSGDVKGDLVDTAGKKSGRKEESELLKKHRQRGKVREKMVVEQQREDATCVKADNSRVKTHDDVLSKTWKAKEKNVMLNGVKDEVVLTQVQKVSVAVDKYSRTIMHSDGHGSSGQKNGVKLHSDTGGPSVEVEEHFNSLAATESEKKRRGKIKARGTLVIGRNTYDTGNFKAEENFGSLAVEYVKKDTMHVNSNCKKMVDEVSPTHRNYGSTPKLEYMEPVDFLEKSKSSVGTEMVKHCGDKLWDGRNGTYQWKRSVNNRHQTERKFAKERNTNSGKFNDRMKGTRLEKGGFMWVKKGEASAVNSISND